MKGEASDDAPPDLIVGLVMARTGRLPDEIERQDYLKLMRAWQIVNIHDKLSRQPDSQP